MKDTSEIYKELIDNYSSGGKPIEIDFQKLINWKKKGDQLTHQLHPYPAKLLPHIAHFFVHAECLSKKNSIVLDPFAGTGTVALEASIAGHIPYVADANPLALLISRVKTHPYDELELATELQAILHRAKKYKKAPIIPIVNSNHWYNKQTKTELEIILRSIKETPNQQIKDFFLVCFSATARKLSYCDPTISVPVKLREKSTFTESTNEKIRQYIKKIESTNTQAQFKDTCLQNILRVTEANSKHKTRKMCVTVGNDARNLTSPRDSTRRLRSGSIPLIITSPPYGSAQKYIRASSISLNWLEFASPSELTQLESVSIGREHLPGTRQDSHKSSNLPSEFNELIELVSSTNALRAKITKKYLEEIDEAVGEMSRVLAPSGVAAIVIGNNSVCGHPLRNDKFLAQSFTKHGMKLELHLLDTINSRGLMTKRNRTASVISRESVLVFRKPENRCSKQN